MFKVFRVILMLFLGACYVSANAQVKFSIDPRIGLTVSSGQIKKEYRKQEFKYPIRNIYSTSYDYSIGVHALYKDRWNGAFRIGTYQTMMAFENEYPISGSTGFGRGFSMTYLKLHTEYTFYRKKFDKGVLNEWGFCLQGELALGYDYDHYFYKNVKTQNLNNMSLRNSYFYKDLKVHQTKLGQGSLALGVNAQLIHKGKRRLKIGALFNYVPSNAAYFEVTYYDRRTDEVINYFQAYGSKYWMTFYASYPIPLFTLKERNQR